MTENEPSSPINLLTQEDPRDLTVHEKDETIIGSTYSTDDDESMFDINAIDQSNNFSDPMMLLTQEPYGSNVFDDESEMDSDDNESNRPSHSSVASLTINDNEHESIEDVNDSPLSAPRQSAMERRAYNVKRNQERMKELGIEFGVNRNSVKKKNRKRNLQEESLEQNYTKLEYKQQQQRSSRRHRGMLLPNSLSTMPRQIYQQSGMDDPLQRMYDDFPGRQLEIKKLYSILSVSASSQNRVPPPIFVTGVSGTGKSMIVRSIIEIVTMNGNRNRLNPKQKQSSYHCHRRRRIENSKNATLQEEKETTSPPKGRPQNDYSKSLLSNHSAGNSFIQAYVNCGTTFDLSPSSCINDVVVSIYEQFERQLLSASSNSVDDTDHLSATSRSKMSNIKNSPKKQGYTKVGHRGKNLMNRIESSSLQLNPAFETYPEERDNDEMERLIELENRMEQKQIKKGQKNSYRSKKSVVAPISTGTNTNSNHTNQTNMMNKSKGSTAVFKLGCALNELFQEYENVGHHNRTSAVSILVLDHAERLLDPSLQSSKISIRSSASPGLSFLSQLLLLPQLFGIHLTVVVVTNSILLERTGKEFCSTHKLKKAKSLHKRFVPL
jgi:hypothetical protein